MNECSTGVLGQLDGVVDMLVGDLRRVVDEGIGTGQLEHLEAAVGQLALLDLLVVRQLVGPGLTDQLVLIEQDAGGLGDHQLLVGVDDVGQVLQPVRQLFHCGPVAGVGTIVIHLLCSTQLAFGSGLDVAKEAPAGIARVEHAHQFFFVTGTIQQSARHTEHQQVRWRLANDLFAALVVRTFLDQLGLDEALVVQLNESVKDILVG